MPLAEWTALEASGGADDKEYVVEAIVDERGRGRKKEVVVKWAVSYHKSFLLRVFLSVCNHIYE